LDPGLTITVFLFASSFALIGILFSGRRVGRFDQLTDHYFYIENYVVYVLGATLTILGVWGITISTAPSEYARGLASVNSWICGSVTAVIAYLILGMLRHDLHTHHVAIYQGFIAG